MTKNSKIYLFTGLIITVSYLLSCIIANKVLLLDDLDIWGMSMMDIMSHFNFTSRPVSAIPTGILAHLSVYSPYFLYLSYIFGGLSFFFVYKALKLYTKSTSFSILSTLVYALLPIASSTFYSPIMLNSSISVIFYCLSFIYIHGADKTRNILYSSFFILLSFLSYEISLPLLGLNVLMVAIHKNKFTSSKNYWLSIFLTGAIPIIGFLFYKNILEDLIYGISYNREKPTAFLDMQRNLKVIVRALSSVTTTLIKSFVRGVVAMKYYSFLDVLLLITTSVCFIIGIKKSQLKAHNLRVIFVLSLVGFGFASIIYILSEYLPTIYGYRNRTMAFPKLFLGIMWISAVFFIAKFSQKIAKILLSLMMIGLSIFAISVKNAWIHANDFNNLLFQKTKALIHSLPEKDKGIYDFVMRYNRDSVWANNGHFILYEQVYQSYYETPKLSKINKMDSVYNGFPVLHKANVAKIPQTRKTTFPTASYPYYYVKPLDGKIFVVRNEQDFLNILKTEVSK